MPYDHLPGKEFLVFSGRRGNQLCEHLADFVAQFQRGSGLRFREKVLPQTDKKLRLQFIERALCDRQKLPKILFRLPAVAFSYVRRNRNCGSAHLLRKGKLFLFWQKLNNAIYFVGKVHSLLPDDHVTIVRPSHQHPPAKN